MKRLISILLLATSACAQQLVPHNWPDTVNSAGGLQHMYRFTDASGALTDAGAAYSSAITAAPLTTTGTVTYSQPGYDPTSTNNGGVLFAAGAYASASDSSVENFSWHQAWVRGYSFKLNSSFPQPNDSSTYDLACKTVGTCKNLTNIFGCGSGCNGSAAYIQSGGYAPVLSFEFAMNATGTSEAAGGGQIAFVDDWNLQGVYALPVGASLNCLLYNPGDGNPNNIQLFCNGVSAGAPVAVSSTNTGAFGGILSNTVTAGGTGYSNSFAVTYTLSGGTCAVTPLGTATASGGVISAITNSGGGNNFGQCTWGTTFTPVLTAGGGTGGTATAIQNPADITNAGDLKLGDVDNQWGAGTITLSGEYSSLVTLTSTMAQQQFAAQDWYRAYLGSKPATPRLFTYDNDHCADTDSDFSFVIAQRAAQMGYLKFLQLNVQESNENSAQMGGLFLARGGQWQVPESFQYANDSGSIPNCTNAIPSITTSPLIANASYPDATTTYRTILAAQADSSVIMIFAGPETAGANLVTSPSDGIYAGNGQALIAAKVSAIYIMGGQYPNSGTTPESNFQDDPTSTAQIFDLSTGFPFATVPVNLFGYELGSESSMLPGSFNIYPPTSVLYNVICYGLGVTSCTATPGADGRQCWDCNPVVDLLVPSFFTMSASGTNTIDTVTHPGGNVWASTFANNQRYATLAVSPVVIQSFIASMVWSDPARHSWQ